ncbi:MAG TPA: glycogen/starch/alpha-glucan family phosphorylase, partial [Candidatus Acidoferrum sp.]|nr:glycogen/starch/alpha-glucan family phosphorylase [Candidatus Acidoferrum sp.]
MSKAEADTSVAVANSAPVKVPKAPDDVGRLLKQYGCGPIPFVGTENALYERHLLFDTVVELGDAGPRERFEAVARSVRDVLAQRWLLTQKTYARENPKRVYYLSMEFLIGRSLSNNVNNLLLYPVTQDAMKRKGLDRLEIIEQEPDAGLGNGGLGRLAACFLDSMATMELPATGYGLRYEYGMFRQGLKDGWQIEHPDNWLRYPDPWEVARLHERVGVRMHCGFEVCGGRLRAHTGRQGGLIGVPYDRPVVGYGGKTINTLRLWEAAAPDVFDFQTFSHGDFVGAVAETLAAESVTRVLYPDDSTAQGKGLRFVQEYFLVACSLADLVRRFRRSNKDWKQLPDKVAIQLNDTHPALAVPELMRLLLDEAHLGWDTAWDITQRTLAYTNHTLLPEALEKWPVAWFEMLLPRHLEIIYEINRRLLEAVRARYPSDEARVARMSLIEEGPERRVRMANLAIVGSHSTNGVAAIHSRLLRTMTVKDLAEMFPERFSNKTNGVTPRRWLLLANPALAVSELMRILLDEAQLGWDAAWQLTKRTLAYTNHTLLPEALEKWPVRLFETLIPRHLEIVYEINRRFLDQVRARFPDEEGRLTRMSLIEERPIKQVRMAHLAIVG